MPLSSGNEVPAAGRMIYVIDPLRRLVTVICSGALTEREFHNYQDRLKSDPGFDPSFSLLVDLSAAGLSGLGNENLRALALNTPFNAGARRAFVIPAALDQRLVLMFKTHTESGARGDSVRAFRSLDEALRWLPGG